MEFLVSRYRISELKNMLVCKNEFFSSFSLHILHESIDTYITYTYLCHNGFFNNMRFLLRNYNSYNIYKRKL